MKKLLWLAVVLMSMLFVMSACEVQSGPGASCTTQEACMDDQTCIYGYCHDKCDGTTTCGTYYGCFDGVCLKNCSNEGGPYCYDDLTCHVTDDYSKRGYCKKQ